MAGDVGTGLSRWSGRSAMLAGLLMLVADAASLALGSKAFWIWSLGLWLSFYCFAVTVAGVVLVLERRAPVLAALGGGLALAGSMMGATMQAMFRIEHVMTEKGMAEDTVREMVFAPPVMLSSQIPGLMFPIGWILLAVALGRTRVLSASMAWCLGLGALLFPLGRIVFGLPVSVVSDVFLLVALVALGRTLSARSLPAVSGAPVTLET